MVSLSELKKFDLFPPSLNFVYTVGLSLEIPCPFTETVETDVWFKCVLRLQRGVIYNWTLTLLTIHACGTDLLESFFFFLWLQKVLSVRQIWHWLWHNGLCNVSDIILGTRYSERILFWGSCKCMDQDGYTNMIIYFIWEPYIQDLLR